jgi:hypothetical protein
MRTRNFSKKLSFNSSCYHYSINRAFKRIYLFFFICFSLSFVPLMAQECGTTSPTYQSMTAMLNTMDCDNISVETTKTVVNIPIQFFVILDEDGDLPFTNVESTIANWMSFAAQVFPDNFAFSICEVIYLDDIPQFYSNNSLSGHILIHDHILDTQTDAENTLNIAIVNAIGNRNGLASFPDAPRNYGITMARRFEGTFVHELGHWFSIFHTHQGNDDIVFIKPNDEHVFCDDPNFPFDLCDCSTSGDMICDTNVDPGGDISPCDLPVGCETTIPCAVEAADGMTYNYDPPYNNFMSYYTNFPSVDCRTEFSDDQKDRMLCALLTHPNRSFLLDTNNPTVCNYSSPPFPPIAYEGFVGVPAFNINSSDFEYAPFSGISLQKSNNGSNFSNLAPAPTDDFGYYNLIASYFEGQNITTRVRQDLQENINDNTSYAADNGVSILDIIIIRRDILNIVPLNKPYEVIAADVSFDGAVTIFDLLNIQRVILGLDDEFSNVPSWRFFPNFYLSNSTFKADFETNPFSAIWSENNVIKQYDSTNSYMEEFEINLLDNRVSNEDTWSFYAIKSGDVTDDANITPLLSSNNNTTNLSITTPNHNCINSGEYFTLYVKGDNSNSLINGFQIGLYFPTSSVDILGVDAGDLPGFSTDNYNLDELKNGIIKTLWDDSSGFFQRDTGQVFFRVYAKSKTNICNLENFYSSSSEIMISQIIENSNIRQNYSLVIEVDSERIRNKPTNTWPNPMVSTINFDLSLIDPSTVSVTLTDQFGNAISQNQQQYLPGNYTLSIINTNSLASGVIYYYLTINSELFTGTIIKQ